MAQRNRAPPEAKVARSASWAARRRARLPAVDGMASRTCDLWLGAQSAVGPRCRTRRLWTNGFTQLQAERGPIGARSVLLPAWHWQRLQPPRCRHAMPCHATDCIPCRQLLLLLRSLRLVPLTCPSMSLRSAWHSAVPGRRSGCRRAAPSCPRIDGPPLLHPWVVHDARPPRPLVLTPGPATGKSAGPCADHPLCDRRTWAGAQNRPRIHPCNSAHDGRE